MQKYLILIILILLSQQTQQTCDPQCRTCNSHSPYDCTSCSLDPNANLYIKSCQPIEPNNLFFYIAIVLIIVHLIMIILGYGVYRNVFENLQMLALIGWGYGSQSGANQLVILNFTVPKNNSFISTFGVQFFLSIAVIGIFIVLVSAVDRLPHKKKTNLPTPNRVLDIQHNSLHRPGRGMHNKPINCINRHRRDYSWRYSLG